MSVELGCRNFRFEVIKLARQLGENISKILIGALICLRRFRVRRGTASFLIEM